MSDHPTRILRLTVRLNIAGPTLQAILLTKAFQERGYESILISGGSPDETDSMYYLAQRYGIEPRYIPELYPYLNPIRNLAALWSLYRVMREWKPDIVHTHTTTAGFIGRIAARMAGVPIVVHTLHVHPFRGYYNQLRTTVFSSVERIGAALSDSIITLSESLRRELVDRYHITSRQRINVLPLGFDLQSYADTPRKGGKFREQWNIPQDAPLVGIIGRILPVKNHALFLDAAAKLVQQIPEARFVIIGDGYLRNEMQDKTAALGLMQQVFFTGWVQDLADVYSDLDVLAVSSWNEGTPVPIIEALAAGCPVVATEVGGIPDLLDGGKLGALVPSGDADALAAALIETLQNPPEPDPARSMMLDRYGLERLANDLDSLYRGLMAKKRLG